MINFTDAQMLGAIDKKAQDQYNYLVELLSTYLTRGKISNVSGENFFDLANGTFNFSKDANNYFKYDGETFEFKGDIDATGSLTVTKTYGTPPDEYDVVVSINDTDAFQVTRDGVFVGGISSDGYLSASRLSNADAVLDAYITIGEATFGTDEAKGLTIFRKDSGGNWKDTVNVCSEIETGVGGKLTYKTYFGKESIYAPYLLLENTLSSVGADLGQRLVLWSGHGNSLEFDSMTIALRYHQPLESGYYQDLEIGPYALAYKVDGNIKFAIYPPTGQIKPYGGIDLSAVSDSATAATHYYIETSGGNVVPKTLANAKTEIVTKAAVEASLTGAITSHTHDYMPRTGDSLADGTDLNTLYGSGKSGSYYLLSSYTYTNAPTTFGVLIVDSLANGYTRQEVVRSGLKKERYRNTTTWTDWVDVSISTSGTFTPVVIGATSAGTGTYTTQSGTYVKMGNMVYVNIALVWTAHTGTGTLRITGLPYTSVADYWQGLQIGTISNLTFANQLVATIYPNNTFVYFGQIASNATAVAIDIDTAATVHLSGWYRTNE